MPNITLAVSDEVYRAARIWAAAHGTTVSAIVRTVLQNLPAQPEDLPASVSSLAGEMTHPSRYPGPWLLNSLRKG